MPATGLTPIKLYGSQCSYFTGKLEMYFRVRGIQYELIPIAGLRLSRELERATGVNQMPAAQLADGRWMTDTTPIIAWLEDNFPGVGLIPADPVQRFFSLLLEDYADEWLWRPAMHFRWYTDEGAMHLSRRLVNELATGVPLPGSLLRWFIRQRQRRGYTAGDGINEQNRIQVEAIYHDNLAALEAILQKRPYLLGERPSLADIGFTGSMFRHFAQDPIPGEIMRQEAPAVAEWLARLWNYTPATPGEWLQSVPEDWAYWLDDIGRTYLPYLNANIEAMTTGKKRFDCTVGGVSYRRARSSAYRIWCLERLRQHFNELPDSASAEVRRLLEHHHCWEPLWKITDLDSGVNRDNDPPFGTNAKMIH